ncbi:MAG: Na+/H+ antiporter NhaA [Zetaproteobacteria bacterium]|nr:Na+/H+ antiporter NhaA [Zetaproteobacteria bacterium]
MNQIKASSTFIIDFFKLESASGIILIMAAILALIVANSPLAHYYDLFLQTPVSIQVGTLIIAKPLLLWINDGLMTVFFFLVGLELKKEMIEGEFSNKRNIILPAIGALGGMIVPALIYAYINMDNPVALKGWAIPTATDIAFALGVLAILGSRIPVSLKIFLTSLAVFDDLGAIIVIALFYTAQISTTSLIIAAICIIILIALNYFHIDHRTIYIVVALIMWTAMLKSGVHATLTGVIVAMFIPMTYKRDPGKSPLKEFEHDLHATVAFFILPLFAFANSGLSFSGITLEQCLHPVPVGTALALFLGKQFGVFTFCWLAIQNQWASLPQGMNWLSLYGTAALCGIGFTMSLFIGSLAFEESLANQMLFDERLGIIIGSLASAILGVFVLKKSFK